MKRLTALLLFVMLTMLPLSALAEPATPGATSIPSISASEPPLTISPLPAASSYVAGHANSVKIWGRELTSATPYYKNGNNGAQGDVYSDAPAAWNAYYDASTGVLKLNGLTVTGSTATTDLAGTAVYGVYADGGVTMELSGNSSVSAGHGGGSWAVYVTGDLTLRGTGTLQATAGTASGQSTGMLVAGGLTVSGGTLTAAAGAAPGSYGLYIGGNISVSGGAVSGTGSAATSSSYGVCTLGALTVSVSGEITGMAGNSYSSWGVVSNGALTVSDSGEITGTGGTASGEPGVVSNVCTSIGVHAGSLLMTSGSSRITAMGGAANGAKSVSYGMHTDGAFTVSGGTLTAMGGAAQDASYGIRIQGALTVSGGALAATAGVTTSAGATSLGDNTGLYTLGETNVTGGTVSGTGNAAKSDSFGVYGAGACTVSGSGKLTGTGGTGDTSYGVIAFDMLTVSGGGKLIGTGDSGTSSCGVVANTLTVSDSGNLTGTGGMASGYMGALTYFASIGVRALTALTVSGGTLAAKCAAPPASGTDNYCYGVHSGGTLTVSGGRLTAETATPPHNNMNALAIPPDIRCASYYWRTAIADDYTHHTQGGASPYRHAVLQTYVDIREGLPPQPGITVSVPRFSEGQAPDNEQITVEQDDDFDATNNFLSASLGSTRLDLGAVGRPGTHGSVEDGSIVIRLKKDYLDTLTVGDYTLTVNLKGPGYTGRSVGANIRVDPALPPLPSITVSVPRFYEGQAPDNEQITVAQGAGFDATNNFLFAFLDSATLDVGTVGHPGAHGSVENGSIVIRLNKAYLDTLTAGDYTLAVYLKGTGYLDRFVSANIHVDPALPSLPSFTESPEIPDTGDTSGVALWACIALLAAGAFLTVNTARYRGKRKADR